MAATYYIQICLLHVVVCLEVVADEREGKWTWWEVSPDEQHADVVEESDEDEKKGEKLEE